MTDYEKSIIESTKKIIMSNKDDPAGILKIKESMNAIYRHFKKTLTKVTNNSEVLIWIKSLEKMLSNK